MVSERRYNIYIRIERLQVTSSNIHNLSFSEVTGGNENQPGTFDLGHLKVLHDPYGSCHTLEELM